jgi:phage-related protein
MVGRGTLLLTGISGSIRVDSEARIATTGGLLATHRLTGEWPRLEPGVNSIQWTGFITKLEITPNWRWL